MLPVNIDIKTPSATPLTEAISRVDSLSLQLPARIAVFAAEQILQITPLTNQANSVANRFATAPTPTLQTPFIRINGEPPQNIPVQLHLPANQTQLAIGSLVQQEILPLTPKYLPPLLEIASSVTHNAPRQTLFTVPATFTMPAPAQVMLKLDRSTLAMSVPADLPLRSEAPVQLTLSRLATNWQIQVQHPGGNLQWQPQPAEVKDLLQKVLPQQPLSINYLLDGKSSEVIGKLAPQAVPAALRDILQPLLDRAQPRIVDGQHQPTPMISKPTLSIAIQDNQPVLRFSSPSHALATITLDKPAVQKLQQLLSHSNASVPVPPNSGPDPMRALQRQVVSHQQAPTESLINLITLAQEVNDSGSNELKTLLAPRIKQILSALPQATPDDSARLQRLLSQPAVLSSPATFTAVQPKQGFVAGIVAMLQLMFASRLSKDQPELLLKLPEVSSSDKPPSATQARGLWQDLTQLEQKHQLLKTLRGSLANHTANRLQQSDSSGTAQSLYYHFAVPHGEQAREIELLIREEPEQSDQAKGANRQHWHLSMRLSLEANNALLANVDLYADGLELNIYAADDSTVMRVKRVLPLLLKRFEALGIDVLQSRCEVGKIPDSLQQHPYHLIETRA